MSFFAVWTGNRSMCTKIKGPWTVPDVTVAIVFLCDQLMQGSSKTMFHGFTFPAYSSAIDLHDTNRSKLLRRSIYMTIWLCSQDERWLVKWESGMGWEKDAFTVLACQSKSCGLMHVTNKSVLRCSVHPTPWSFVRGKRMFWCKKRTNKYYWDKRTDIYND